MPASLRMPCCRADVDGEQCLLQEPDAFAFTMVRGLKCNRDLVQRPLFSASQRAPTMTRLAARKIEDRRGEIHVETIRHGKEKTVRGWHRHHHDHQDTTTAAPTHH